MAMRAIKLRYRGEIAEVCQYTFMKNRIGKWLRATEKYTKTDMVYLAKGGFWLTFGDLSSAALAFLISVIYANFLPKEIYGSYRYILSIFAILNTLSLTGMNTAVTQAVARGHEGVLKQAYFFQLRWGVLQAISALAVAGYYYWNGNLMLAGSFALIAIFAPFANAANTYLAFLNGKKLFQTVSIFTFIANASIYGLIAIAIFFKKDVLFLILANFLATAVVHSVLLVYTFIKHKPNNVPDEGVLSYGRHLTAIGILGTIAGQLDSVLVFHYYGPVALSIYAFATLLPDRLKGFAKTLSTIALPKYAEKSLDEIRTNLWNRLLKLTGLMAIVATAYVILSPLIFRVFFPAYHDSIVLSQWYGVSLIAGASTIPVAVLLAQKRTRELYIFSIAGSAFQILLTSIAVPLFGLPGAAAAKISALFFNFILAAWLVRHLPLSAEA